MQRLDATGLQSTRGNSAILMGFLREYPLHVAMLVVLDCLGAALEGLGVGLMVPLLKGLTDTTALETGNRFLDALSAPFSALPEGQRLSAFLLAIVGVVFLKNSVGYARQILSERLRICLDKSLQVRVMDQLLRVGYRFICERRSGDLLSHFNDHVPRTGIACRALLSQVSVVLMILVYATFLMLVSWQLTLAAVGILAVLSITLNFMMSRARALGGDLTYLNAERLSVCVEALQGMRLVRLFGGEITTQARYDRAIARGNRVEMHLAWLVSLVRPLSELVAAGTIGVLLLMGHKVFSGQKEVILPVLLTFMFALYRLLPLVTEFNRNRVETSKHEGAIRSCAEILSPDNKPYLPSGSVQPGAFSKAIVFEQVMFAYGNDGSAPALRDINLELKAGRTTALVGASGAGKSTLVDLIPRFYDPVAGRILIDDVDLKALDLHAWRSRIGFVSQDPFLFNTTIRENIGFGSEGASLAAIEAAADRANAMEFIEKLSESFDTPIGDRGVMISGGQRQRIAMARAILRDPELLILDEATSALDAVSEKLFQQALAKLSRDRTVLVIAHRLSTIIDADHVVVLADGGVAEQGTHRELIARKGTYWQLHSLQDLGALSDTSRAGAIS